ncbi:hypothetical protein [Acidiphilium angustum]|uniref:hypothetical protein n=1 Tax=Acidiphilium angustum TaxID=523 RepID=UPI00068E4DB7|nr:hypothetical protein [Acidiphilium angustum]
MSTTTTVYYLITAASNEVMQYGTTSSTLWPSFEQSSGAQQINSAQYATLLAGGRFLYLNSQIVPISSSFPLAAAQTAACTSIDLDAEQARLQFITPGFGQMMVYLTKAAQAQALLATYPTEAAFAAASPPPSSMQFPLLFDEIGITASTAWGVASVIAALNAEWLGIAALIERTRLAAKGAVMGATTQAEIATAMTISWPTPASMAAATAPLIPVTGALNQIVSAS